MNSKSIVESEEAVAIRKISTLRQGMVQLLAYIADAFGVISAYAFSLMLRFGAKIPMNRLPQYFNATIIILAIVILVFSILGLYRTVWRTTGIDELLRVALASLLATCLGAVFTIMIGWRLPITVYFSGAILVFLFSGSVRVAYRVLRRMQAGLAFSGSWRRTMLVGAGETGLLLIRQMSENPDLRMRAVIAVDDDPTKIGKTVRGIRVAGNRHQIPELVEKYKIDLVVLCIPSAGEADRHEIIRLCTQTSAAIKTVPSFKEIVDERAVSDVKDIDITDLLTREPKEIYTNEIREYLSDRVVMVTGGGGSIGSELCRQIVKYMPSKLVIFEIYENSAYDLQQQLLSNGISVPVIVEIGTIRDVERLNQVFEIHRPEVVFHAAAHKHVPLMENSPAEAVKNNIFGTYNVGMAAINHNTRRFILISTDKAVNPTSVMGASKRLAEHVIQYLNSKGKTKFAAVRFGNVLGSNGSAIPLFQRQIAMGGPVTVTDKRITRYFMTIPEAARLVLTAGHMAETGEIFILDMGEPVNIDDIARTLIRLSGYRPDIDIKIEYTGLRPGEKLYEELFLDEEKPDETRYRGIYIGRVKTPEPEIIEKNLEWLKKQVELGEDIRTCFTALLSTYRPENKCLRDPELCEEGK